MLPSAVFLLVASCATTSNPNPVEFTTASLYGMIYDYSNQPCKGVSISVDSKPAVFSDIDGRFVLSALTPGVHTLYARKTGYEPLSVVFEFRDRTQVLYLKMVSFNQLLNEARNSLGNGEWAAAKAYLDRASAIRAQDPVLDYLKAILDFKEKDFKSAATILRTLVSQGDHNPYILLFLADLYQYHLDEPKAALPLLRAYLANVENPQIQSRYEKLAGSVRK